MTTDNSPEEARRKDRRRSLLIRLGQAIMALGAVIGITHWAAHLTGEPPAIADILVGYPTAGLLIMVGAILAGQKR